jgi:TRAP-type mannitol/chloroaromatic compound transport system permease large subunit
VWFGIVVLVMVEMSLLAPPNGVLVSTVASKSPRTGSPTGFSAAKSFIVVDVARVAILIAFPPAALYLPSRLLFL